MKLRLAKKIKNFIGRGNKVRWSTFFRAEKRYMKGRRGRPLSASQKAMVAKSEQDIKAGRVVELK